MNDKKGVLDDIQKLIVETDEKNSKIIAEISNDPNEDEPIKIHGNYRVRRSFKETD